MRCSHGNSIINTKMSSMIVTMKRQKRVFQGRWSTDFSLQLMQSWGVIITNPNTKMYITELSSRNMYTSRTAGTRTCPNAEQLSCALLAIGYTLYSMKGTSSPMSRQLVQWRALLSTSSTLLWYHSLYDTESRYLLWVEREMLRARVIFQQVSSKSNTWNPRKRMLDSFSYRQRQMISQQTSRWQRVLMESPGLISTDFHISISFLKAKICMKVWMKHSRKQATTRQKLLLKNTSLIVSMVASVQMSPSMGFALCRYSLLVSPQKN